MKLLLLLLLLGQDPDARPASAARPEGGITSESNPAHLANGVESAFDLSYFGLLGSYGEALGIDGDIMAGVDSLFDQVTELNFGVVQGRLNSGTALNGDLQSAMQIVSALGGLQEEGQGVMAHNNAGLNLRWGSIGIYYRDSTFAGIDPSVNLLAGSALTDDTLPVFFGSFTGGALTPAASALSAYLQANTTLGAADNDGDFVTDADEIAFHAQQALGDAGISSGDFQQNLGNVVDNTVANAGTGVSTNTLFFNQSGVRISGIRIRETGLSLGIPIEMVKAGITIKEVIGETFQKFLPLNNLQSGQTLIDDIYDFDENTKKSNRFSVDAGVAFGIGDWVSVGLTIRNIIPMEFEMTGGLDDFAIDPQVRLGVHLAPWEILNIAIDLDLLEQDFAAVEDWKTRLGALTLELNVSPFMLRLGAQDNLASDDSDPVFTAGIGLNIEGFHLDVAALFTTATAATEAASALTGDQDEDQNSGWQAMLGYYLGF